MRGDAVSEGTGAASDQDCGAGNIHAKAAASLGPTPVVGNGQGLCCRATGTSLPPMKAIAAGFMAGLGLLVASAVLITEAKAAGPQASDAVPLAKRESLRGPGGFHW